MPSPGSRWASTGPGSSRPAGSPRARGAPGALGAHLEELTRAAPQGQEILEGPGSAAEAEFLKRAYPADTISLAKVEAAQESFRQVLATTAARERARGSLQARAARWVKFGPNHALYPFTERRNSGNYVPNTYVAGGRTTDLAIAETCEPGDCRMYITPAGGGVWRTDNALAANIQWTYLGGPLGINAAGTVTIDPTDPSGETIWVGTGEANVCGSGCVAGVGIYRSTNGGDSWRGPLGRPGCPERASARSPSTRATTASSTPPPPPPCAACRRAAASA